MHVQGLGSFLLNVLDLWQHAGDLLMFAGVIIM